MSNHFSSKTPPAFNRRTDDYDKWKKKFRIWQSITDEENTKQGGLLVFQLDDYTQDTILELVTVDDIKQENGAEVIIGKLDIMFKKEDSITAYEIYEEFKSYRRGANVSIADHCREFQRRLSKVIATDTKLAEPVLAFKLLKSSNLTAVEEQLIMATINKMTHADMEKLLKKVFPARSYGTTSALSELNINKEERTSSDTLCAMYGSNNRGGGYCPDNA